MYIEELSEAVGHLKAAAIRALMKKLGYKSDGNVFFKLAHGESQFPLPADLGMVFVAGPDHMGNGGGETVCSDPEVLEHIENQHNFPVQFDNIRGFVDEIFTPFLTLTEPSELESQEPSLYNALQNLYIDVSSGDINPSAMPGHFQNIFRRLGEIGKSEGLEDDTVTSVALDAFRSNFLEDVQRKISNISKEAMISHVCLKAQYASIEGTFIDAIAIAREATELFNNYENTSDLRAIKVVLETLSIVNRATLAGTKGLEAAGLTLLEIGLDFLKAETDRQIELGGPTYEECFESLRQAARSISDELFAIELGLANALKSSAEKITTHPIDYDHDPEGKGPGFRDVINLPTGPLAAISEVHLTSIIDDLGEAIPYLQELSLEAGATRGADLGYSTHGAMTECQDLIISISKTLEDLKQDVSDGKFNLDATIAAINNADNLLALQMQEITADLMES